MRKLLAIVNVWMLAFNIIYLLATWSGNLITLSISAIGFGVAYMIDTRKEQVDDHGTLDDHLLK